MKKLNVLLLLMGVSVLFFGCSENALVPDDPVQEDAYFKGAKKPAAVLVGEFNCPFTLTPPTFWNGTVDFGDLGTFGITFFSLTEPRAFSQASTFKEEWVVYYENTDYTDPANVVLRGWSKGVVTYANKAPEPVNFLENGKVTEAYGELEAWEGCNWHGKGLVYFTDIPGLPEKASGTVRIN